MNCKNTRSCCSPCSALAQQLEETNTRAVQAYNIAVQCLRNPLSEDLTINADLIVNGDIFQYGAAYETHAEKVYTNDDYIVMREGAVSALAAGDYSGFQVTKYDGTNDGRLVIDRDGTARVGDVNDEQPLATRDEAADLTDGHLLKWDAANLKLTDAGAGSPMEFLAKGNVNVYVGTPYDVQSVTINLPSPAEFVSGYDYMVTAGVLNANDYSVVSDVTISLPNSTVTTPSTSFNIGISAGEDVVVYWYVYRVKADHAGLPNMFGCFPASLETQPKLVSGTNIKTINNTSILGSGDITIAAGGMTWIQKTDTKDWTGLISSNVALKNIYVVFRYNDLEGNLLIPKGYDIRSNQLNVLKRTTDSIEMGSVNAGNIITSSNTVSIISTVISVVNGVASSSINALAYNKILDTGYANQGVRIYTCD